MSHAQAAVAEPVARPRPRPRSRKKSQSRARGGILWIAVSGILLAGVVFVNVAVLRLNLALDGANSERVEAARRERCAAVAALERARIAADPVAGAARLGLVYADPSDYGYVDLAKK